MAFFNRLKDLFDSGVSSAEHAVGINRPQPAPTPAPINSASQPVRTPAPGEPVQHAPNLFSRSIAQINPLDNGRTFKNPTGNTVTPTMPAPSAVHQLTHNGVTNVAGGIAKGVAGMSGIPAAVDATRLASGEITHNQPAIDNATTNLARSLPQALPIAVANGSRNFGQKVATTITAPYAEHVANQQADYARRTLAMPDDSPARKAAVEAYALGVKGNLLNQHLATAGITPTDANSTIARKTIGSAGELAANLTVASKLPGIGEGGLARNAATFGGLNAAAGVAGVAEQNDPSLSDYAKAGALGFVSGAALPAAIHVAPSLVRGAAQGAQKAGQVAQDTKRELDIRTTPTIMNLHPNERYTLSDYADMVTGRYKPENTAVRNQLEREGRAVAKKAGVDITSGSPVSRNQRIAQFLDSYDRQKNAVRQGGAAQIFNEGQLPEELKPEVAAQNAPATRRLPGEPGTPLPLQPTAPPVEPPITRASTTAPESPIPRPQTQMSLPGENLQSRPPQALDTLDQGKATRYASKTVPNSEYVSEPVGQQAKLNAPSYVPENERTRYTDSLTRLRDQGEEQFHTNLTEKLDGKLGTISAQDVSDAQSLAAVLDAKGDPASLQRAADIYDKVSAHLTKQGQSIQAAAILSRRTPESLAYGVQKQFKQAGVEYTPELQAKVKAAIDEVRNSDPNKPAFSNGIKLDDIATNNTKTGLAGNISEREYAVKKLQKLVTDNIPASLSDKIASFWKAGLLTGIKTQTGNALSNGVFGALHAISNPLAAAADLALSKFTGVRSKTLTGHGLVSGAGEGYKKGYQFLKTGIDERTPIDSTKFEGNSVIYKNPVINAYVNGVFKLMGAADRPAYYSQLRNSLYDLARADAVNKGLKGQAINKRIAEFVKEPPIEAFQTATDEAEKAVLGNDTALSRIVAGARQGIDRIDNKLARGTASTALNVLAPFTKVPSAFLNRVIDFTPLGAVKEAGIQIAAGKLDQRALTTALSEATTGTALIWLGYNAAQSGQLSGDYPNDPAEQQRWKAQGIQPNSLHVGNKWLSLNYFGPLGLLFNAGKRVSDTAKQGESKAQQGIASVAGLPKDLLGQSFLQGLSGFTNAVNDPTRSAKSYVNSQVGSAVPTIVGDVANATDRLQRGVNNGVDAIKNKIPGLRRTLLPGQDVYGNTLQRKTDPTSALVNPLRPSDDRSNPVISEVGRLHDADPNNKDLSVTPTQVDKSVTVENSKVNLSDKQRYDLQKKVGQATQDAWGKLIQTPEYKALDDVNKAQALKDIRTRAVEDAQRNFVVSNNLGTYSKQESPKAVALSENTANVADYATNTNSPNGTTISTNLNGDYKKTLSKYAALSDDDRQKAFYKTPNAEYNYEQAKYENDKQNGKNITKSEQIKEDDELAKLKAGQDVSKDTRDLYALGKQDLWDYVSADPNGKKIANDLIAYGDKLAAAGVGKNKFRNSKGAIDFNDPNAKSASSKASSLPGAVSYNGTGTLTSKANSSKVTYAKGKKGGGKVALRKV